MQIIKADRGPKVEIHYVERTVAGNGVGIKVYGEMKIAAKERVYAHELKLNTIKVLVLTTETGTHHLYHPQKYIVNKGAYGNYASVDIFDANDTEMTAGNLPQDGSIWLNFIAMGE